MAILNTNIPTNLTEYPNSFKRQGAFPLEAYSIFYSLSEAEEYATNSPIAYVGQILTVINNTSEVPEVKQYSIINEAGDLKELGKEEVYVSETNTDNNFIPNNATIEIVLYGTTDEEFINIDDYYKKTETYSRDEVYTKEEVDELVYNIEAGELSWDKILDKPDNLATTDYVTEQINTVKAEIPSLDGYAKTTDIPTDYVPNTRAINNKTLNDNIVLEAKDIGTYTKTEIDLQLSEKVNTNTVISIEKGGTGATTAGAARTNLEITPDNIGAANKPETLFIHLGENENWSGGALELECEGITKDDYPIIDIDYSSAALENNESMAGALETWSMIRNIETLDGKLKFYTYGTEHPTKFCDLIIRVVR